MLNTTIQIRIDEVTKRKAQKKFRALGLDLSSGVKLVLKQAIETETIPFIPMTTKGLRLLHWEEYKRDIAWAHKHGKRYTDVDKLLADLEMT